MWKYEDTLIKDESMWPFKQPHEGNFGMWSFQQV